MSAKICLYTLFFESGNKISILLLEIYNTS
jgi:hypothetical protein